MAGGRQGKKWGRLRAASGNYRAVAAVVEAVRKVTLRTAVRSRRSRLIEHRQGGASVPRLVGELLQPVAGAANLQHEARK
jgi:hypothetical protein